MTDRWTVCDTLRMSHHLSKLCIATTLGLAGFGLANAVQAEDAVAPPAPVTATAPAADAEVAAADEQKKAEAREHAAKVALVRSQGYKPTMRNGEEVYCKRQARLGSRFEGQTCGSVDELARMTRESHDAVEEIQRQGLHQPPSK